MDRKVERNLRSVMKTREHSGVKRGHMGGGGVSVVKAMSGDISPHKGLGVVGGISDWIPAKKTAKCLWGVSSGDIKARKGGGQD